MILAVDQARGELRSLNGQAVTVRLDPARTSVEVGDRNGDGAHNFSDVALGDRLSVSARLQRSGPDGLLAVAGRAVVH